MKTWNKVFFSESLYIYIYIYLVIDNLKNMRGMQLQYMWLNYVRYRHYRENWQK